MGGSVFLSANRLSASQVVQWGDLTRGVTGAIVTNPPPDLTNAVALAGGFFHSLALTADGRVVAWGQNNVGQTNVPPDLTNVIAIAAGGYHNLAVTHDGTVRAWGHNGSGQTNIPFPYSNVVQVAASEYHSLALLADGSVMDWGASASAPLALDKNCVGIAAGARHSVGIAADGTVHAWGDPVKTNVPAGLSNVVSVVAGRDASIALTAQGTLASWPESITPLTNLVKTLTNILQISMERLWCTALEGNGKIHAWGAVPGDDYGQTNPPVGLSNVVLIAAGRYHGMALIDNENPGLSWSMQPPTLTTNGAALEIPTQRGRLYIVERSDGIHPTAWSVHRRLAGNGSVQTVPMATNAANAFYRVRRIP